MAKGEATTYEEVAQYLLNKFAEDLELERVESKQKIVGLVSGRVIEIDAKGIRIGNEGIIVIECKRYDGKRKKGIEAEKLEALCFRIEDLGAEGGIVVSPHGLQEGAQKIADAKNVISVQLNANANADEFMMRFLNQIMAGLKSTLDIKQEIRCQLVRGGESTKKGQDSE